MTIKTIFLDRDGIINKEINYLYRIEDCIFIREIFETCQYFQKLGYKIIIITNQSGISRGYYNEKDFHKLTSWMLEQFTLKGVNILDVFYCPHGPKSICKCRKPNPGMFLEAKIKHNISMDFSWMIGDNEIDIEAANRAGIHNTILIKGNNLVNSNMSKAKFILDSIQKSTEIIT
tara:strand:- start:91 stop:615 length:525 start_codon:yes stop_codon:yes gene_type:complete